MTRVNWNADGERFFEAGVDRGVLFVDGLPGVAWNGLISVDEAPAGAETKPFFIDGYNYLVDSSVETFSATITAFYSPMEFDACDGVQALSSGLYITQQPRRTFGLSYRTKIGNDLLGAEYGYKIHFVYNALAAPSTKSRATIADNTDISPLAWQIATKPRPIADYAASAHFIVDSTTTPPDILAQIETIIYGSDAEDARLPLPEEIIEIFKIGELGFTESRLTSPNRTLLTASWGTATLTDGARTIVIDRDIWSRQYAQNDVPLLDDFARLRANTGWGIAKFGGKWSHTGGTDPGNYSVENGVGRLILDTPSISRHSTLGTYDLTNQTVAATFGLSRATTEEGGAAVGVAINRQDSSNGYRCKLAVTNPNLRDLFTRADATGLGTLTSGETWSTAGGSAADYSIVGNQAKVIMSAKNSSRRFFTGSAEDQEVLFSFKPDSVATGGSFSIAAMLRYKDSNNHYLARVALGATGDSTLSLQSIIAGATTNLTTETVFPNSIYTAGKKFWLRAKVIGDQLMAKAWADGDVEPTDWLVSLTTTTITGVGSFGGRAYAFSSNTNPNTLSFLVDDFYARVGAGYQDVVATIQKHVAGTLTDLVSVSVGTMADTDQWRIEAVRKGVGIEMRAWKIGTVRPIAPTLITTDATYTQGKSGVYANYLSAESPLDVLVSDFFADGTVVNPVSFTTSSRVYLLDQPYDGVTVDKTALIKMMAGTSEDLIDIAMQFMPNAPVVRDDRGIQIRGDAHYGSRDPDGSLVEGSDFNDYMGVPWYYGATVDTNEVYQFGSLDCSGYIRMVFGPMGMGYPVRLTGNDGVAIPRVSYEMVATTAPGAEIVPYTGFTPSDLSVLQIGDVVGFDADSNETSSGQIDHVGIYLGLDDAGKPLFVSSRKSIDGPTFSASGGSSELLGAGLYATRFRVARRF